MYREYLPSSDEDAGETVKETLIKQPLEDGFFLYHEDEVDCRTNCHRLSQPITLKEYAMRG